MLILLNTPKQCVCACTQRMATAARESRQRDRPGGLTSPVFHACGSASPVRAHCRHSSLKPVDHMTQQRHAYGMGLSVFGHSGVTSEPAKQSSTILNTKLRQNQTEALRTCVRVKLRRNCAVSEALRRWVAKHRWRPLKLKRITLEINIP